MSENNISEGFGSLPEDEDMSVESIFGSVSGGVDEALPVVQDVASSDSSDASAPDTNIDANSTTDNAVPTDTSPNNNERTAENTEPPATPESSYETGDTPPTPEKPTGSAKKNTGKKAAAKAEAPSDEEPPLDLFAVLENQSAADVPLPSTETADSRPDAPQSIFDRPPLFSYGGVKELITDASLTFEDLRLQKADDFPELSEGRSVSWRVKYGAVTKFVSDPKSKTIADIKEDIEQSKQFLDGLKKAKGRDKNPDCLVTPSVTAKSKGVAQYKGFFLTEEEAEKSDKAICLIPSRNGRIMEMRKLELGRMVVPKKKIVELAEVRAGFTPALPRIPREIMGQIVSFFRCFMSETAEYEALVLLFWDRKNEEFVPVVPKQRASKATVHADLASSRAMDEDRYLLYADIHSHNSMAAKFSAIDDRDERASRLYIVIGRLDRFYPDITARISCGGTYLEIDPDLVMEGIGEEFPTEWLNQVERVSGAVHPAASSSDKNEADYENETDYGDADTDANGRAKWLLDAFPALKRLGVGLA